MWLAAMDARLAKNTTNKYVVGESMTIADIALGGFIYRIIYNEAS